jgi:hypothetical protein
MPIELGGGEFYLDRLGSAHGPMQSVHHNPPYAFTSGNLTWVASGHYWASAETHRHDLISIAPVAEAKENAASYFNGTQPDAALWLSDGLSHYLVGLLLSKYSDERYAINCAWPNPEKGNPKLVNLWPTQESRSKGRAGRIQMKPGRAFLKILPRLDSVQVSELVDAYKAQFYPAEYTAHQGKAREDFRTACGSDCAPFHNIDCNRFKSLSNSCMQKQFWGDLHPCEAYASGDFTVYWLQEGDKIAARAFVANDLAAPIYAVSDAAGKQLEAILTDAGIDVDADGDAFEGAKLLLIRKNGDIVAPYLDLDKDCEESRCGQFLILGSGDITCEQTSGLAEEENRISCEACGDRLGDSESYSGPDGDCCYCESCYSERYTGCNECDEEVSRHDVEEVNFITHRGRATSAMWCECCREEETVETLNGELWKTDDCTQIHSGDYVSNPELQASYTQCDMESEYYPDGEVHNTEQDGYVNIFYLKGHGYIQNEVGTYFDPQLKLDPESETEKAA